MNPTKELSNPITISHQLTLMLMVFVVGFSLLALIHYYSSQYRAQLDQKLESAKVQGLIGSEIIGEINELERSYYQITTLLNPKARDISLRKVNFHIERIEDLMGVLKSGGTFSQTLILNLPEKDNFVKQWDYVPINHQEFDILKIDIQPKLIELKHQFAELNAQMNLANDLYLMQSVSLTEHMSKVQMLIKNTAPLFIRLLENTNRVHYQQQNYLQELSQQVSKQKQMFEWGVYGATLLLFALIVIALRFIGHHIKCLANDLHDQKEQALAATKSKSVFLANMSHEIRTPLNAITGFIALLKQGETDPTKKKYLNTIEESSASLIGIINDILDFSKIESNKLEIDYIDFNPHTAFTSVADLFKARSSEKNITLYVKIDKNIPNSLHSDPLRIKQVLTNLLSNAVKFTDANHSIHLDIEYKAVTNILSISVSDEGIGITQEQLEKIFQPFSQAESDTTRKFGGTGLGLTISRLLVELLGGQLQVESQYGRGSRFFFEIPVQIGQPLEEPVLVKNEEVFSGKLLLVEDNRTNQLLMGAIFKKLGIEFDLAKDGLEAVDIYQAKSTEYDLILMDENMPNMSGSQATIEIRAYEDQTGFHIPIIALTANAMKRDKERFLEAGMDDYLHKPIVLDELKRVLSIYMKH